MVIKISDLNKKLDAILEDDKRRMGIDIEDKNINDMKNNANKYYKNAQAADNEFDAQYWLNMLKYNSHSLAIKATLSYFDKEIKHKVGNLEDLDIDRTKLNSLPDYSVKVFKSPEEILRLNNLVEILYSTILEGKRDKKYVMLITFWLIKSRVANELESKLPYESEVINIMNKMEEEGHSSISDTAFIEAVGVSYRQWYNLKEKIQKYLKKR